MKSKKSDLPFISKEQDDRPDDTSNEDGNITEVRPPGSGSYYYDDSTGYEVYTPDDEGENDESSGEFQIGKRNKESDQSPDSLSAEH
jgi:hypothetical protein